MQFSLTALAGQRRRSCYIWFRQRGKRKCGDRITTSFKLTSLTLIRLIRIPFAIHETGEKNFMNLQNALSEIGNVIGKTNRKMVC